MFGNRKVQVAVQDRISTREIVTSEISTFTENHEHLVKLYNTTDGRLGINGDIYNKLKDAGLVWFVQPIFIYKFKYHASLFWPKNEVSPLMWFNNTNTGAYIGDIPDSVMDKIAKAKECGIKYGTVHSMYPMPVAYQQFDPVAIGWLGYPGNTNIGTNLPCVILGIWDHDKEIEVL